MAPSKVSTSNALNSSTVSYKVPLSYTKEKIHDFHVKTVEFERFPSDRIQHDIIPSLSLSTRAIDLKISGPIFMTHRQSTSTISSTSTSVSAVDESS